MKVWQDPIIAEIHKTREQIAQRYGNDLHAIFAAALRGELSKPLVAQASSPAQQDRIPDIRVSALTEGVIHRNA